MADSSDKDQTWKVIVNNHKQYGTWPIHLENPSGWMDVGHAGTKSECLAYIKAIGCDYEYH
jgi:MbtH protein